MKIEINGEARDVRGPMLADVLAELGYDGAEVERLREAGIVAMTEPK